jgi:hypothetical protein
MVSLLTAIISRWTVPFTLIGPGEVKVDLADFDLKLQKNLLSTYFFLNSYSYINVFQIFMTQHQKITL